LTTLTSELIWQEAAVMVDTWIAGTFLAKLSTEARAELFTVAVRRRFDSGRRLFVEGDRSSHVELLINGFVKVTTSVGGVEALLAIRMPGDILGETGALGDRPRTATVTACGRITSAVVTRANFSAFLRRHPDAALNMAAVMGERLRWANRRRADFAAFPAEVRLAGLLVEIARICGHRTDAGLSVGVALSQPELATMVGVAQVTAQKAIRDLRARRVIRTGYRSIVIVDLDALIGLAREPDSPMR
jgi:CRP/FNR family transcriptional regulator, cyclic AMP receptor protein